jgi:hypothetical protein
MFRAIQLTMSTAPHHLIRRTVQRQRIVRKKLTLLSLPNDTFVDLILIHLCVRDILRLRSVCMRHIECYISIDIINFRYADYSTN